MIFSKFSLKDLVGTEKGLESKLAECVGKRGRSGLPENFDIKACSAAVTIAIWNDLEEQYQEQKANIEVQKQQEKTVLDGINDLRKANPYLTLEQWQIILDKKYRNLRGTINAKMPEIWPGLEFELSSLRILNIEDCTLPLIAVLLGRPGSGKTVDITLLSKWIYTYYTDSFSPKAWVSHTTTVDSEDELQAIDMLPKIKDKQFLTPELTAMFNVREDELKSTLNNIIRIADGHGLSSDSGAHGHRGYGDTMFTWVGAVIDIPRPVYKVLSGLGPKLYFFRLPFKETSDDQILKYITNQEDFNTAYSIVREALFDYLTWFEIGPTLSFRSPNSSNLAKMAWNPCKDEREAMKCIVQLAKLLGYLRREGAVYTPEHASYADSTENEGYQYFVGPREDVKRTATVLKNLARGHALITGRNYVTTDDIPIVVKTVLSTARIERVEALIALLDHNGVIRSSELAEELEISRSKAYRLMVELKAIGLVDVHLTGLAEYIGNNPAQVKVMKLRVTTESKNGEFDWFLTDQFKKLRGNFTPVDNRKYMDQAAEDMEKEAVKQASEQ
jgi:hypothetical protein